MQSARSLLADWGRWEPEAGEPYHRTGMPTSMGPWASLGLDLNFSEPVRVAAPKGRDANAREHFGLHPMRHSIA